MSFAAVFDFALSLIHSRAKQPKRTEIRHASLLQDNPNEEFQRKAWEAFLQNIKSQVVSPVGGKFLFISYAWDDPVDPSMQRWLTQLQKDLQMSGFEVFLDLSHMHDDMNARMLQGIERSAAALIICTPRLKKRASQKTSVAFELSTILSRKQDNGDSFQVLPLIYSGDFKSSVPDKFVKFLVRDCTDLTHYNAQLTDLANPLGIIPAILGVRKGGQSAYEPLLSSYRLACLSNLPAPNVDFTGRASLLDDLAEGFRRDQDTQVISHKPQAIRGLGGVGKTELALHYSHTHQASYDICRWIVSDGQHLSMSMRLFAEQAGIDVTGLDYDNDVVGKLYDYLSDHSWLLVFDNVEDAAAVRGYLPPAGVLKPNQHVLITSRSQAWAKVLTVDEFSESEAMAYINAHIDTQDQASIQALAIALGGLPLALSQAIAYMRATGVTVSLYLELLRANPVDALSEVDQDLSRSYPHTVWSTWALSREKIGQDPMAERMLHACAWMAADNIPLYLFEDEDEGVDKSVVFRALKTLRAYSMVDVTKDGFIKIHRLVQAVLQDSMRGDDSCLVRVIEYMSNAYPWHKQTQSDFDRTRDLLEHLDVVLKHAYTHQTAQVTVSTADWTKLFLQVSAQLSDAYGAFGDDTKRSELLEQALRISQTHYGPDHVEVAKTLINLGNAYGALGAAAKQRVLLERALPIMEAHYDPAHVEVARILGSLGNAYGALGDAIEQRVLLERALPIMEAHYDPAHVEVARILGSLGNAYGALGDAARQRELLQRALRILEAHYGPAHVEVARILGSLGNAYGALGDAEKQREMQTRALRIMEAFYGHDHVEVARSLGSLGNAYGALGDAAKQRDLLEQALRIMEAFYGHAHVEVARTLGSLGNAYGALGDAAKQRELLEQALLIIEANFGPNHVLVAFTLDSLGNAYGALGDAAKQREMQERAVHTIEAHYGPNHVFVARSLDSLGNAYGALGDAAKQREMQEQALRIQEAYYGPDHVEVAGTLGSVGNAYGALGDAIEQCQVQERALRIMEAHYDPEHVEVARILGSLGNAYGTLGDTEKQCEMQTRALRIMEAHYGPAHVEVARTLASLGNARCRSGPCIPLRPFMALITWNLPEYWEILAMLMVLLVMLRSNARCRSGPSGFRRPTMALLTWRWLGH
jgi:tetratricopeptide (TPR) repeat protein